MIGDFHAVLNFNRFDLIINVAHINYLHDNFTPTQIGVFSVVTDQPIHFPNYRFKIKTLRNRPHHIQASFYFEDGYKKQLEYFNE